MLFGEIGNEKNNIEGVTYHCCYIGFYIYDGGTVDNGKAINVERIIKC